MDRPHPRIPRAASCAQTLRLLLAGPLLFSLVGCRNNQQAHRDIYLRELRLQEDEIYRLEDCIQEYQGVIREQRVEMNQLKSKLGDSSAAGGAPRLEPVPEPPRSVLDGPVRRPSGLRRLDPPVEDEGPPGIDVPAIDLGEPMAPPPTGATPPLRPGPLGREPQGAAPSAAPPIDIPPLDIPEVDPERPADPDSRYGPSEELPPLGRAGDHSTGEAPRWDQASNPAGGPGPVGGPVALELPTEPLGGLTVDGYAGPALETGEPTLVALVRPRSLLGEPVRFAGQASLMLIDPSADGDGDGEKLARWDFSAAEVASSWREDAAQPVLDLAVVLPQGVPQDRELELWVRLVDEPHDQKVLEQSMVVLDRLASVEQATLASASPRGAESGEQPTGGPHNDDAMNEGWRASDRAAVALATTDAADSGWRQSDQTREPNKIRLATHEATAPLPIPPAPKAAAPAGGPMEWSPTR